MTARTATVVGVDYSGVHRALGVDTRPLGVDACLAALSDAGLTTADVNAIFEYPRVGTQNATLVRRLLGIGDLKAYADIGGFDEDDPANIAPFVAYLSADHRWTVEELQREAAHFAEVEFTLNKPY